MKIKETIEILRALSSPHFWLFCIPTRVVIDLKQGITMAV